MGAAMPCMTGKDMVRCKEKGEGTNMKYGKQCRILAILATGALCLLLLRSGQARQKPSLTPQNTATKWTHGLPARPDYFPIAVWLQSPANAAKYKAAGINLYVALWQGPTEEQIAALKTAGMPVICEQNTVGLAHKDDATIVGWMHGDEPDNAQAVVDPKTGKQTYGPCIPPARIVSDYERLRAQDPTRPIMLNLGQGVANDGWLGRGAGASLKDYETYVNGGDIVSFDVYPVAGMEKSDGENYLWVVPKGVDRLREWTSGHKSVWNCIECTRIGSGKKPTPEQVRAETWMALIHGSRGLIYFAHEFAPKFNEHALLDDPEMLAAVTATNRQIQTLAPVLNNPTLVSEAAVQSSSAQTPIDIMVKRQGKSTYLFAAGMRNAAAQGTFMLRSPPPNARVEVIGESRTLPLTNGRFTDDFKPHAVHLYRIAP